MSVDPLDTVVMLRSHLEELERVIHLANSHFIALDLADGYRAGRTTTQYSKLTNLTNRALVRIKGYLDVSEEVGISPDEPVL